MGLFSPLKFITMEKTHYVYRHVDPETQETMYVGIGQSDRAWSARISHRNQQHVDWIVQQYEKGFTMQDIVEILNTQLCKKEAEQIEFDFVQNTKPKFNKLKNPDYWHKSRSYDKELAEFAKNLHEMGYGYIRIAYLLNTNSHMLVKRMINNV